MVDPWSFFSVHQCSTVGVTVCGMYCLACGVMHKKVPLLLIGKNSPCGGSGFPLSLSELSFTICSMPYNPKCVVK